MTQRKLKIAISICSFTPNTGGLQAHAQNLCKHLQQRGHDVQVITRSASRIPVSGDYLFFNEKDDHIQVNGIPVRPLKFSRIWAPVLWVILKTAARPALKRVAARLYEFVSAKPARIAFAGFDIIHHVGHSTAMVGFAAAQAAKQHGIPFLVQPTAHPLNFGDSNLDFQLYHKADRLLAHTHYERDYFISKGVCCSIDVVGNGIEDRSNGEEDRFRSKYGIKGAVVLYIGRKAVDKGYPLVVEAFKRLRPRYPNLTLVCMGPDYEGAQVDLVHGILDLGVASEDVKHDVLAACTCLCVPSAGESFGLVYMEAGRYGKPSIGRNLPALRELLGQGKAALLLGKPNDYQNTAELNAEELATGIQQLLDNPELCRQIGEECRKVSSIFVWPKVVKHFENAYQAALVSKKS